MYIYYIPLSKPTLAPPPSVHSQGLAVLSVEELRQMCDEMSSKFSCLSEELITGLQCRDVMAGEVEAKNRCVGVNKL